MDGHVTPVGKSVLDAVRLDPGCVVKARLAIRIQKSIAEMGLKQREAAAGMGITQPKLSLVARGKLDDISQAKLEASPAGPGARHRDRHWPAARWAGGDDGSECCLSNEGLGAVTPRYQDSSVPSTEGTPPYLVPRGDSSVPGTEGKS